MFGEFTITRKDKISRFWAPKGVFYMISVIIIFMSLILKSSMGHLSVIISDNISLIFTRRFQVTGCGSCIPDFRCN